MTASIEQVRALAAAAQAKGIAVDTLSGTEKDVIMAHFRPAHAAYLIALVEAGPQLVASAGFRTTLAPKWAGEFKIFGEWVATAQRVLESPSYCSAICVDAKGRRCAIGKDFARARDEGAFPVRYFWQCEVVAPASADNPSTAGSNIRDALKFIHDTFKRDLDAGYKTKDKEFAVSLAAKALAAPAAQAPAQVPTAAEVRDQALEEAERAVEYVMNMADAVGENEESAGAYRGMQAIRALRTASKEGGAA